MHIIARLECLPAQPNAEMSAKHRKTNSSMSTTFKQNHLGKLTLLAVSFCLLLSGFVQAQTPNPPHAGADQMKLELYVGEWSYTGSGSETPLGPGGKFAGTSTGRMVLDGLFLEWSGEDKGVFGGKEITLKFVEMFWFDPITKNYLSHGP